jgi:hypothetical protein
LKFKTFEAFWKQVPNRGEVAVITRDEMKRWSETVFIQARRHE